MRATRDDDRSSLVSVLLGRVDLDRLEGGYAVASRKNISGGKGQRVVVQYSANRLEGPKGEEFNDTIYLLIPSDWKREDLQRMDGRYYECRLKSGAPGEFTLRVGVNSSSDYL